MPSGNRSMGDTTEHNADTEQVREGDRQGQETSLGGGALKQESGPAPSFQPNQLTPFLAPSQNLGSGS